MDGGLSTWDRSLKYLTEQFAAHATGVGLPGCSVWNGYLVAVSGTGVGWSSWVREYLMWGLESLKPRQCLRIYDGIGVPEMGVGEPSEAVPRKGIILSHLEGAGATPALTSPLLVGAPLLICLNCSSSI